MTDLARLQEEFKSQLAEVSGPQALENLRVAYLGRKGKLAHLFSEMGTLSREERPKFGELLNQLKRFIERAVSEKEGSVGGVDSDFSYEDPTLPGVPPRLGRLHPITQTIREIGDIFTRLGFEIVDGREIETEFYNFTALNIPLDHPSRDAFDTFYTEQGHLLRSQTSTVQIRVMEKRKPPVRIIAPGKVYRPDEVDASHSFMFHQIEGLMVDDRTTFSDLKGVIHLFLRKLFGNHIEMRFKPHFFPFTEPSVDVDISWGRGWLEILGAGQVHPAVFEAVGYDPKKVQGFAFGLGVERIAMLKYGIKDIRLFFENDLRFLEQF
ncbi:MAG: phenylalanine--tRNA ligase subunit alpha [Candidatus Omnitrophica bacterium]|nr:phenylalanine--tRNA ligase subunit alpha [Candidatus Omnitrophota bacterium]